VVSVLEYNTLLNVGFYKTDAIRDSIEKRRWAAIVLANDISERKWQVRPPWFTGPQMAAVRENYKPDAAFGSKQNAYVLYIPKK